MTAVLTLEEGYARQRTQSSRWLEDGRLHCGFKVALTNAASQARFDVDQPCFGRLFADMRTDDGGDVASGTFQSPRIEVEIAFGLGKPLVAGADPADAVEAIVPAIEIVETRYANGPANVGELVADNASAAGFVLGAALPFGPAFDFTGCRATARRNGVETAHGEGRACLGNPLNALAWLANELEVRGDGLRAGDLVLAGSLTPPFQALSGDEIHATISGLGSVGVRFEGSA